MLNVNENRRWKLLKYTVRNRSLGGAIPNWFLSCFGPTCNVLAKRVIKEFYSEAEFHKIRIRGYNNYLYLSKMLPIISLYQTLAEQLYDWQWHYYQIPQTKVLPSDIVVDCGCAEGIFSFINQETAKHIYAFEPLPEYIAGLAKTFEHADNVTIVNSALAERAGTAYLIRAGIASSITLEETNTQVNIDTVDRYCLEHDIKVSYIKADLEGYETNLLQGAAEVIRAYRPKIAITTYHKPHHADEISEYLLSIIPSYQILTKGIEHFHNGGPVMLHAW